MTLELLLLAQVTLVPGTASTWTDGVNTWAGNPSCNQIIDPYIETTCTGHTGPISALLCPDSPAIDFGVVIEGFHCPAPGSALSQPLQADGSYCVEWYGNAPDAGACEFVASGEPPPPPPPPPSLVCDTIGSQNFVGCYYDNADFTNLAMVRTDGAINFDWADGSPDPLISPDTFSVLWQGDHYFPTGVYRFTITTDDGMRLYVDGAILISQWFDQAPATYTADLPIAEGWHRIAVEYYENGGGAVAQLSWILLGSQPSSNTAPIVDAGPDQGIIVGQAAQLSGAVTDDGLPAGNLVWEWSQVSGPGNGVATFADRNALQTAVTFSRFGTYTLRLSASDGELVSSDDITIRVRRR